MLLLEREKGRSKVGEEKLGEKAQVGRIPQNKDPSSMKHATTVGGASRAGTVSTLLPGSYGALGCENASRVT